MIKHDNTISQVPRRSWSRLLQAVDTGETLALANHFSHQFHIEDIQLPESGLALLKNRDGAQGEDYFLGEIPLARAHVRITTHDHQCVEGGAQILDDRTSLARAIAILDAILAHELPGCEQVQQLMAKGETSIKQQEAQRHAMLSTTRVDFSLLGNDEDEHDD